eukprot:scaffold43917_cov27-Tisochrysis_lutea.AAC.3
MSPTAFSPCARAEVPGLDSCGCVLPADVSPSARRARLSAGVAGTSCAVASDAGLTAFAGAPGARAAPRGVPYGLASPGFTASTTSSALAAPPLSHKLMSGMELASKAPLGRTWWPAEPCIVAPLGASNGLPGASPAAREPPKVPAGSKAAALATGAPLPTRLWRASANSDSAAAAAMPWRHVNAEPLTVSAGGALVSLAPASPWATETFEASSYSALTFSGSESLLRSPTMRSAAAASSAASASVSPTPGA